MTGVVAVVQTHRQTTGATVVCSAVEPAEFAPDFNSCISLPRKNTGNSKSHSPYFGADDRS